MNEFFNYCRFDNKCHTTLKNFVSTMERLGHYLMRNGLKQWYKKTFKPVEIYEQQHDLSDKFRVKNLKQRMFYAWFKLHRRVNDAYTSKTRALFDIWNSKVYDIRREKARAFTIWRDVTVLQKRREHKLRLLVWKVHCNRLNTAW